MKELKDYTDFDLKYELQRRENEENEKEALTLPEKYYPYKEVTELEKRENDDVQFFVAHVEDGSEGHVYLIQVNHNLFDGTYEEDEKIENAVKHHYVSRGINEGWDANHENIDVRQLAPYGNTMLKIDIRTEENERNN